MRRPVPSRRQRRRYQTPHDPGTSAADAEPAADEPAEDSRFAPAKWIATTVAAAVVGSAAAYFGPPAWQRLRQVTGSPTLQVTVLFDEQFDSALSGNVRGEHIWPVPAAEVPHDATPAQARDLGAVDADSTLVRLNFRSSYPAPVTIQQIAVDVDKAPPLRGTWSTGGQGGAADVRFLAVDLDEERVRWVDADLEPIDPLTIYVTDSEEENVDLLATATRCYCRWTLRVTYTTAGQPPASVTVPAPGIGQFRTSSTQAAAVTRDGTCTESPVAGPPLCP